MFRGGGAYPCKIFGGWVAAVIFSGETAKEQ